MTTPICLVGHTHVAEFYYQPDGAVMPQHHSLIDGGEIQLEDGGRYIVNCGGVGQPRDGNPLAAYGLYDSQKRTIGVRRVAYDVPAVQRKMTQAGLPSLLIERLTYGR
jgi:diadenosine tetraphosphatase ApaH/serine/threonine PP2A family protein phosphatase